MGMSLKKSGVLLLCASIIVLLFNHCTFEPHHEFISQVKAPEPITVSFIINDPTFNDPYYLVAPTRLIFKLKDLNNAILSSEITLNGRSIESEIYRNGVEFGLNPHLMAIGSHSISMTFNVDTKSGSLANRLGAEFYIVKQKFTLIIDPTPPVFNSFEAGMENGFLKMKWSGTDKTNFVYKIKRTHYGRSLPDTLIQDTRINHFIEPGFVGGEIHYQVVASGVGFEKIVGSGVMEHFPGEFDIVKNAEGVPQFIWSNPSINTENVQINIKDHNPVPHEILTPFTSQGSIDLITPRLGDGTGIIFDLYRKGFHSQKFQLYLDLPAIPNIKPYKHFEILNNNTLLLAAEEKLYRYSLPDMEPEDSLSYAEMGLISYQSLTVNSDGTRAYISGNSGSFISFDPMSFDKFINHDLEIITREFSDQNKLLSPLTLGNVTNDGLVSIAYWRGHYNTMLFDIKSGNVLWHSPPGHSEVPTVSDDGKYLSTTIGIPYMEPEGWIYRRDDDQYNLIGKIKAGNYAFLQGGTEIISIDRLLFYQEANISAYNLLNPPNDPNGRFNKIRNVTAPAEIGQSNLLRKISYDLSTNYLAVGYYNQLKLLNASTMLYEKTIYGGHLEYSKNYILISRGFIEAVK